jgi:hypothetical protein
MIREYNTTLLPGASFLWYVNGADKWLIRRSNCNLTVEVWGQDRGYNAVFKNISQGEGIKGAVFDKIKVTNLDLVNTAIVQMEMGTGEIYKSDIITGGGILAVNPLPLAINVRATRTFPGVMAGVFHNFETLDKLTPIYFTLQINVSGVNITTCKIQVYPIFVTSFGTTLIDDPILEYDTTAGDKYPNPTAFKFMQPGDVRPLMGVCITDNGSTAPAGCVMDICLSARI